MGVSIDNLAQGEHFITASGSMEQPLGITIINFTLMKGTDYEHQVGLPITVVDTLVHDALLGIVIW